MASKTIKRLIPFAIVAAAAVTIYVIVTNPPQTRRSGPAATTNISVEVLPLDAKPFIAHVSSFGTVQPRVQTKLSAQVSGQVITISDDFREGGFFDKGDTLIQLDDRDHRAQVQQAQANLMSAKQALQEEQARVEQAETDWQRLGNGEQANDLVLRKPQLAAAQAAVLSAQAQLDKANLDLERTKIKAPFAGRVLEQMVDVGEVVSANTELGEVYASDVVEVRLPIKNSDLPLIKLPVRYVGQKQQMGAKVSFHSTVFGEQNFEGRLVRTEGAIDSNAQQLYVVGQINEPFVANSNQMPIKIGQYINADIEAEPLNDAIVIPNSAIYQGTYVYTVVDGNLLRKNIKLKWQNTEQSVVSSGLNEGELLVLTPLGQVSSGTPVSVLNSPESIATTPQGSIRGENTSPSKHKKRTRKQGGDV